MRKSLAVLAFAVALTMTGCAASNPASTARHNVRLANADLAAALNKIEATALSANQSGIITTQETINVSQVINNLTVASDGIERCTDNTVGTISGCIQPLIASIQLQMTPAGLGIKSPGAVGTFTTVISGVNTALTAITNAEGGL